MPLGLDADLLEILACPAPDHGALRPGMPRFCGGLAGYFGYDTVRFVEPRLAASARAHPRPDPLGMPVIQLVQCEELAVIDNLSGRLYLIVYADPATPEAHARAKRRLRELEDRFNHKFNYPWTFLNEEPFNDEFKKCVPARCVAGCCAGR